MTEGLHNVHIVKLPAQGRELYVYFIMCPAASNGVSARCSVQILSFDFKQGLI